MQHLCWLPGNLTVVWRWPVVPKLSRRDAYLLNHWMFWRGQEGLNTLFVFYCSLSWHQNRLFHDSAFTSMNTLCLEVLHFCCPKPLQSSWTPQWIRHYTFKYQKLCDFLQSFILNSGGGHKVSKDTKYVRPTLPWNMYEIMRHTSRIQRFCVMGWCSHQTGTHNSSFFIFTRTLKALWDSRRQPTAHEHEKNFC